MAVATTLRGLFLLVAVFCTTSVYASEVPCYQSDSTINDPTESNPAECTQIGEWNFSLSVGLGARTNPIYDSSDIPLLLLPEFSYYGESFFIENLDLGYTVYDSNASTLNLLATPSYDSVFFNRWDPGNLFLNISTGAAGASGIQGFPTNQPDSGDYRARVSLDEIDQRQFSYLAGIEFNHQFENSNLQLNLLSDITNTHQGLEFRAAYSLPISENLLVSVGGSWKDKKFTNYYYGIGAQEVDSSRAIYQTGSSISPFIRVSYRFPDTFAKGWRVSLEHQQLPNEITGSPIVEEESVTTFFIGKRFSF
jgi:outer membrane protein